MEKFCGPVIVSKGDFLHLLGNPVRRETGVRVACRPGPWPGAPPTIPLLWVNTHLYTSVWIPNFSFSQKWEVPCYTHTWTNSPELPNTMKYEERALDAQSPWPVGRLLFRFPVGPVVLLCNPTGLLV